MGMGPALNAPVTSELAENIGQVTMGLIEIRSDETAIDLLVNETLRAFHHEYYGVTFPKLSSVGVRNIEEMLKIIDAQRSIKPDSTIVWLVKRGDCCYGPNRLIIAGTPPQASPDDVTPERV